MAEISVVIPVYNEARTVGADIAVIKDALEKGGYDFEILVIDDGSTDDSREVSEKAGARVIAHRKNKGVGGARKTGLRQASGSLIVMTDGDSTYPNGDVVRLIDGMADCDMIVGHRARQYGPRRPLKKLAKWLILKLACWVSGEEIPDLNSGFRAFRREDALRFMAILPDTHSWVSTITLAFLTNGLDVKYIAIDYYERPGKSTFHPIVDTYNYLLMIIRTITYFRPLKVFLPVTLVFFAIGIFRLVYDIFVFGNIKDFSILTLLIGILIGMLGLLAELIVKNPGRLAS